MQIKFGDLRQIVQEELTSHNYDKMKSVVRSALVTSDNYVENMRMNNRKDTAVIEDLLRVSKELTAMGKWLAGRNEPEAAAVNELVGLMEKLTKTSDPFKRLGRKFFSREESAGDRLVPVVDKMKEVAEKHLGVVIYHNKYQNFDDDLAQQQYGG